MKKALFAFLMFTTISVNLHSQYADLGTGTLKNQIWWFDWNGFTMSNGASRVFTTADGLQVTITFSNVQGPICQPEVMNTWSGAVLHFLYNFSNPNIKPALFTPTSVTSSAFTMNITATRDGQPTPFKFVAADAEGSAFGEATQLVTNGSNWLCIDFFRNSSQTTNPFAGCNTQTAVITETYGMAAGIGQNPVLATDASAAGSLAVNCLLTHNTIGQMALAFGIFAPVDRGDLPSSYGNVYHQQKYTTANPCNYLPPLPSTTLAQNLKIGAVAGDPDPIQSNDDNLIGADEDGLSNFPLYTGSGSYSLTVPVTNTTGSNAFLTGWFDINRNGIFELSESVTANIANNATNAVLTWTGLPAILPSVNTTIHGFRFRLSSDMTDTQNPSGYAIDGEVEDYIVTLLQLVTPDFTIPDTVCVNTPVSILNTSTNATSSYWNFCVADVNTTPAALNLGNPGGQLALPVFIDYAQYNGNWYGFVTNNTPGKLTRLDFGNSLLNAPVAVNLGTAGVIPDAAEGIQVVFNQGRWYAIIVGGNVNTGGSRIVKLDFGPDLTNTTPAGTNWGNIGAMSYPVDLHLFNANGYWYGLTINQNSTVTRFAFGSSFEGIPTGVNLGNIGNLQFATGIYAITDNGQWYAFITNRDNSTITRLNFGNSLLNTPTGVNLGNPGNTLHFPRDIYVMKFCGDVVGFVVNEQTNDIVKLNFPDLLATPVATSLGNIGGLSFPHSISKLFRVGADLYSFIANVNNNTLTRLRFTGCSNSNIPNHSGTTPPPVTYTAPGTYNVNLTIDDGLPTQASVCKQIVVIDKPNINFDYTTNPCDPFTFSFNGTGNSSLEPYWSFGDGFTSTTGIIVNHTYSSPGTYIIRYSVSNGFCRDTVTRTISVSVILDDIIITPDTTICYGSTKQIRTVPSLSFCWSPTTYLDNPNSANPTTSAPHNITYYFNAEATGTNLIVNGDFSQGNTGFTSAYQYNASSGVNPAVFTVRPDILPWHPTMTPCVDHTSGSGNMMLVNGADQPGVVVWSQTIPVLPDTKYEFATWLQHITTINPATLQFSINGTPLGNPFQANNTSCVWERFFTVWNSGNATTAAIAIINQNQLAWGNDFALDDISFAPVYIKRDSVRITVDTAIVQANNDVTICSGTPVQLSATGANSYIWSPSTGLTDPAIANPIATPTSTTEYHVTGTTMNGCTAKDTVIVSINELNFDFNYTIDICQPLSVNFTGTGTHNLDPYWSFGDGFTTTGTTTFAHTYAVPGIYIIKYSVSNGFCRDTVTKQVNVSLINENIILTPDTTICFGASKRILTSPYAGLNFCWSPTDYLDNPSSLNPVTSTPHNITYYLTAESAGSNLIPNGDFSQGNTGFTSSYLYNPASGVNPGVYTVRNVIAPWHPTFSPCTDHTTGSGNMMLVNGADQPNVVIWSTTVAVTPNTKYEFAAWLQNININNPSTLQFSINGVPLGSPLQANSTSCIWDRFSTVWNSGSTTSAVISIINQNTLASGNDFALDDISFAPVLVKRDSVRITVDTAIVSTNDDMTLCPGATVQLNATGASSYVWTPAIGLSDPTIANPVATNTTTTEYVVAGTNLNGCIAKDTVTITRDNSLLVATISGNETVCKNTPVQLNAAGGTAYSWTPASTLNDPNISNPIATPTATTTYYVTVTDNGCTQTKSVTISVEPDPVFAINGPASLCQKDSLQLNASGGDIYMWQSNPTLNNTGIANPIAKPTTTTTYTVNITHTLCNYTSELSTTITILSPPDVQADKLNDIDCTNGFSQLIASGAVNYEWTPSSGLSDNLIYNPVATPSVTTTYSVKGVDDNGCVNYDTIIVKISPENKSGYHMPNAFTPNNDGLNDCYGIKYWGFINDLEFSIYNRWGERIFFTKDPNACWNGRYKGVQQDIGVYVYIIKAKTLCGDTFKKGLFTLIR